MISTQSIKSFLHLDTFDELLSQYQELEDRINIRKADIEELVDEYRIITVEYEDQLNFNASTIKKSNSDKSIFYDNKTFLEERYNRYFSNYIDDVKKIKDDITKAQFIQSKIIKRNPQIKLAFITIAKQEASYKILEKAYEEGKISEEVMEKAKIGRFHKNPNLIYDNNKRRWVRRDNKKKEIEKKGKTLKDEELKKEKQLELDFNVETKLKEKKNQGKQKPGKQNSLHRERKKEEDIKIVEHKIGDKIYEVESNDLGEVYGIYSNGKKISREQFRREREKNLEKADISYSKEQLKELITEHKRLVAVLKDKDDKELTKEYNLQVKELEEYKLKLNEK